MVECQLPKLKVAGSNPVSRSNKNKGLDSVSNPSFFIAKIVRVVVRVVIIFSGVPETG